MVLSDYMFIDVRRKDVVVKLTRVCRLSTFQEEPKEIQGRN